VATEIVAMALSTVQLNIFAWNKKLTQYVKDVIVPTNMKRKDES